jgi:glycosyltransferase involved in cell wall biosynthesis
MMNWLFIGPNLLAGIGQVTKRYADLVGGEYVSIGATPQQARYKCGFAFVLPIEHQLKAVDQYATLCERMIYMTVCETSPVNPVYGILAKYKTVYCPSEFSREILAKQFPEVTWKLLRHHTTEAPSRAPKRNDVYTFYTIGNIMDPRKNIKSLIEAFLSCEFRDSARLVLKATCLQPVDWKVPGVVIINGLLDDEALERIHSSCDCYVNCSHSEGVGMGAVEAAIRDKPVIISDFGGLKEYVQTPWVIPCTTGPIGFDDFLFTKDLTWGYPSKEKLMECMWDCYNKRVSTWDHMYTKDLVKEVKPHLHRLLASDHCSASSC